MLKEIRLKYYAQQKEMTALLTINSAKDLLLLVPVPLAEQSIGVKLSYLVICVYYVDILRGQSYQWLILFQG